LQLSGGRERRLGIVRFAHAAEDGAAIFRQACAIWLEGIVSKRVSAPYRSAPSSLLGASDPKKRGA
jgi:ATP-dependent DNA ligase